MQVSGQSVEQIFRDAIPDRLQFRLDQDAQGFFQPAAIEAVAGAQVEQVVDNTIVPGVEKLSTGVRDSVSSLWGMATGRAQRPSSARPSGRHTLGDD